MSRLIYIGQTSVSCQGSLAVSAQLTDRCGNALADRQIIFVVAGQSVVAVTDANGIANASIAPPASADSAPLQVSYAGDESHTPAQDSAAIKVNRINTIISYTGKTVLATGAAETVSALLTDRDDRRPIPNALLNFEVGTVRVSATTDARGVAVSNISLPTAAARGGTLLKISFAGNSCFNPAATTTEVTAYLRTAFVVWGGNSDGLSLGQRVNFWGHSWAKQVTGGDYQAHRDFKGYADTINQFRLCQVNARTNGTPRLDDSCWSSKPGQSFPPETLPSHIGVIVTNSMDKSGAPDFGNIVALVVVRVDPAPPYGAVPGKPGFGLIVDVIEDAANIFPSPLALEASQTQPANVLPGQSFAVALNLSNRGRTAATNVFITETFADAIPPSATFDAGTIQASNSQTRTFQTSVPALSKRGDDESNQDYQKRLGASDGAFLRSVGVINYSDAKGRALPDVVVSSASQLRLPRLVVGISAPPCISPNANVPYTLKISNIGGTVATSATARVLFPDATSTEVPISSLAPGESVSSTVNWKAPVIAPKGATESNADYLSRLASFDGKPLAASASVTWKDALGNDYGAVEQQCSSIQRVPILSHTAPTPPPMLPNQRLPLNAAVQNTGGGHAFQSRLRVTNPDASVSDAPFFNLAARSSTSALLTLNAPPVASKQVGETDAAYRARLQAADNRPIEFGLALEWNDAAGNIYGPINTTLPTTEVLPIVVIELTAQAMAQSGDTIVYTAGANNIGHAEARDIDMAITLPGGAMQKIPLEKNALPPGGNAQATLDFNIPAAQPDGQVTALSTVYWKDAQPNDYGALSANAVTNIVNPNLPPTVNAGPDQTVKMSETVTLNGSASDDARPAGSTLTVIWSMVSGPGTVAFANPAQALTTATFSAEGSYVLRLTASDSLLSVSDEAIINVVTPAPPAYFETIDLAQGESVNLEQDEYKHLHISNETKPFNFIWVAVSSKGTIVKIDTETGKILGEYFSSPTGQPRDPSRTTVDNNGNVWASNRAGSSVLRIGLVENGQCLDRNGNGVIDTSSKQNDIRPWRNTGGVDTNGGVETAEDECIINYTRVRSHGTRHVSVDAANDVWVSGTTGRFFDLIDGKTGLIKRQEPSVGFGGYGGLIDKKGVIWSARKMLRWDTALPLKGANGGNWKGWSHDSYGLCIDSKSNIWNTSYEDRVIYKFAPDGTLLGTFTHGAYRAQGCVVDRNDDVWVAHSLHGQTVGHLKNDGTWIGNVTVGDGPTGVAVDARGKIWATNHDSRTVSRIDPDAGPIGTDEVTRVGLVDLTTVNLGGTLYNYSDMTGSTLSGVPSGGTWAHIFDSRMDGAEWGVVGWNGQVCGDAALVVAVASSADGVQFSAPEEATNGASVTVPNGRYLKVVVRFKRASSGESPFLHNVTVGTKGFAMPPIINTPPSVDAGQDQTGTMPNPVSLIGNVCDTGRLDSSLSIAWEKVSGPGTVAFSHAALPTTSATFSEAGEYILRLTASDSNLSASDEVTVLVHPFNDPPTVNAGADQTLILPATANLDGAVSDDALPSGSSVSITWSKISGPGDVSFVNASAATTVATFSQPGTYVLRLVGEDSQLANVDDVTIKAHPPNQPPVVSAGDDQTIRLPVKATLDGVTNDDALPLGKPLVVTWTKVSGPGTVTFANPKAAATTAAFSQPGTYILRLTANDSQLSSSDELTLTVNPANQPPSINAGANQTITLPDVATFNATVADDGLPEGSSVALAWSKVSGPGLVSFSNQTATDTTAAFTQAGTYIVRLTASDSALNKSDDLTVTVNASTVNLPPTVKAGADQTITLPAKATLTGIVGDDRLPSGSTLSSSWSKVSGPGTVTFANAGAAATTATFSTAGEYVLSLTAHDSELASSDEVAVTVHPVNQPPVVKAGADQTISFPNSTNLNATVNDDGQPAGVALSIAWSKASGPGMVTFTDASTAITSAAFSASGIYVLRLTASDSQHTRSDDVVVNVNRAPTVEAGANQTIHLPNGASLKGTVTDDALPAGKIIQITWSKVSGPGGVVFSKAASTTTTATFSETGTYVLRLNANDTLLADSDELTVTVNPPLPPPPIIAISSPTESAEITSRFDVTGSVSNGDWKLEYSLSPDVVSPNNSVWATLASGSAPVTNGVLATFDPTSLLNGMYAIRLTATDNAGQTTTVIRNTVVAGQQKIGNFTVSFEDLFVPVAGLPIQVLRTYDSRDKQVGDFGLGWTLSIKNVRLDKSVELGRYWREVIFPGTLPQYCLQPTRPNIITITFPDNRMYKFQATTTKQCQTGAPIEFARFGFTPMPGTRGSLVPEAPLDITVEGGFPGPVELLNSADPQLRTYNPTLFRFTDENGTVFIIDQKLGLRSATDLNGNRLVVNRDGIAHSSGKSIRFVRDAQGRITQIIDPAGSPMTYTYDANGNLSIFTDRENNQTSFTYDNLHNLLGIVDPRGIQPIRNTYDNDGRLISHTDAAGKTIKYTHNLNTRQEIITNRLGAVTVYEYDDQGNVVRLTDANGAVTTYTHDRRGNKLSETNDLGKTRTFAYDANSNLLRETSPLGHTVSYTYDGRGRMLTVTDESGGVVKNVYDAKGNLTSTKDKLGRVTTHTYTTNGQIASKTDALGGITRYEYDGDGNPVREIDSLGNVTQYTYDSNGNRTGQTTSCTIASVATPITTTFQYDKLNRMVKTTHPDGTITQYLNDSLGRQIGVFNQLGHKTAFEYDSLGHLTRTIYPDGTTEEEVYDAEGRRLKRKDRAGRSTDYSFDNMGRLLKTTHSDGSSVSTEYDSIGRVVKITDKRGMSTRYEYDPDCGCKNRRTKIIDALGNVVSFTYDALGNRTSMTDANNHTTRFEHNAANQMIRVTFADGSFQTRSYDALGRVIAKTDQTDKTTQFVYDAMGRLIRITNSLGQPTRYGYDELGRRTSETDALGRTTRYEYDKSGRLIKRVLPLGMSESYLYDAIGNIIRRVDFNGRATSYSYNVMNQLVSKTPDRTLGEPAVTFSYAANGTRTSMVDASGTTSYIYDAQDRLTSKNTPQGKLSYTYDVAGNVLSVNSSNTNGVSVSYTYDALTRLSSVTDNAASRGNRPGTGTTSYTYDAAGNMSGYLYPNGVGTAYVYDSLNRLTNVTISKASPLARYAYQLGATGARLSVSELNGREVSYTYDAVHKLTGEAVSNAMATSGNGRSGYTYDAVGNRLARTSSIAALPTMSYEYDANDRLSSDTFDENGNTKTSAANSYDYDFEDRLREANSGAVTIIYDGDGNRVSKTVNGVTTKYLVDTNNPTGYPQVVEELVNGNVQRVYTYGNDLISQYQLRGNNWAASFYGYDGQGSVRVLTDADGAITDTYTYDAFGTLIDSTGTTPNLYLYTGEQYDPDLKMIYLRARYMNPASGRFWTLDKFRGSMHDPLSLHKYLYANADPVNRIDPAGNQAIYPLLTSIALTVMRGAISVFYHNYPDVPPTYLITRDVIVADPEQGFYKDFSVDIYGHKAGERFLVVQWIKGRLTEDGKVASLDVHLDIPNRPIDFEEWTLDAETRANVEYFPLDKYLHFITLMDIPGAHAGYNDLWSETKFVSDLDFKTNVYRASQFPNPSAENFRTPTDPKPLLSIPWEFKDTYIVP